MFSLNPNLKDKEIFDSCHDASVLAVKTNRSFIASCSFSARRTFSSSLYSMPVVCIACWNVSPAATYTSAVNDILWQMYASTPNPCLSSVTYNPLVKRPFVSISLNSTSTLVHTNNGWLDHIYLVPPALNSWVRPKETSLISVPFHNPNTRLENPV